MQARYGLLNRDVVPLQAYALAKTFWSHKPPEYQRSAFLLIWGTSAAESNCGEYEDTTDERAGEGHTQWDKMPFEDYRDRCPKKIRNLVKEVYDLDIQEHEWKYLHFAAGVSTLHTAVRYKMDPRSFPLPATPRNLAKYWKERYNTIEGKGTVEKFMEKFKKYVRPEYWDYLENTGGFILPNPVSEREGL